MLNKKIELKLGGEVHQLWFNNYAVFELQRMYGAERNEIMQKIVDRVKENYLLLIVDLVKVGLKGHALAKGEKTPEINVNELVAEADMNVLYGVVEVFYDIMGVNIPKTDEADKKKVRPQRKKSSPSHSVK